MASLSLERASLFGRFVAWVAFAMAITSQAHAQFYTGPTASAMGGAGRAAADPGESAFLNPASLAHIRRYYLSGSYGLSSHSLNGDVNEFSILAADGTPGNLIPGAVSYARRRTEFGSGLAVTEQDIQVAVGTFVLPKLTAGLAIHRTYSTFSTGEEHIQDNGHLGLIFNPTGWLGLGFTAYNFIPPNEAVPKSARVVTTFALGGHVIIQDKFRLRLDLVRPEQANPGHRTDVMFGLESYFRDDFAFRLGGQWRETTDQLFATAGLGFKGPRLSFNYSIQRDVRRGEGLRHMFDLWLPL